MTDATNLELIIQSGYYTGDTASLERDSTINDQTGQEHHGDKLTITTRIEQVKREYFITPQREIFRFGQAIDFAVPSSPAGAITSRGKTTLNQQSPTDAKPILEIYSLFDLK